MDEEIEYDGADLKLPYHLAGDVTDINASIALFEDVLRSVKSNDEIRNSELLKEMYSTTFPGMRQKLVMMIDSFHSEEIIASLLALYDKLEDISGQYLKCTGQSDSDGEMAGPLTKSTTTTTTTVTTYTTTTTTTTLTTKKPPSLALATVKVKEERCADGESSDEMDELLDEELRRSQTKSPRQIVDEEEDESSDEDEEEGAAVHKPDTAPPMFKVGYRIPEGPGSCPICCEDEVPPADLYIFAQCGHQYCKECLRGYYDNLINDNKVLNISCPFPKCEVHVEYNQVQDVVTPEQFARYEEFTFLASLNADPTVRWCPKAGCGNAIIGDPANSRCECTNPECKFEFCYQCSEPWHQDFTCEQYEQWKEENGLVDKKFSKWAKDNTKKCPSCKAPIEKMSGCNHMTCYKCKYEFCWLCNGKYSSNHFDVFNVLGCPGMQSGSKQFGMVKRVGMRALIGTGLVLGGIVGTALAIPAIVIAGPIYGGYRIHQHRVRRRRRFYPR